MIFRIVIVCVSIIVCSDSVEKLEVQPSYEDSVNQEIQNLLVDINKVPDFSLYSSDGDLYNMRSLEGKVVLLNFWATWCGPCRIEIPDFNELYKKHKDDGLEILGISISDTKKALKNFSKSYRVDYPLLFDSPRNMDKITRSYGGVYAVPTSYIIGRKGDIITSFPGAIIKGQYGYAEFMEKLNIALREKI